MATTPTVYYPTADGRPMAETPIHGDALIHLVDVLKLWFSDEPNVYIGRNIIALLCGNVSLSDCESGSRK